MTYNTFICTIKFALLESSKISLFKDLIGKIIDAKVTENDFLYFPVTLNQNISKINSLSKVILDYSDRPNRIVLMNY